MTERRAQVSLASVDPTAAWITMPPGSGMRQRAHPSDRRADLGVGNQLDPFFVNRGTAEAVTAEDHAARWPGANSKAIIQ